MSYLLPYANIALSWGLLVLIWLVQLIIYPGFHRISPEEFAVYHRWYVIRISSVVLPLMTAELVLVIWWVLSDNYSSISLSAGFLVIMVWLSTFALQVSIHNQLKTGKEDMLIRRLVATNWIRTAAWSLKAGIVSIDTIISIF
jgi:hypothetical protein